MGVIFEAELKKLRSRFMEMGIDASEQLYQATKDQVMVAQQLGQKGTSATDLYTHVDQREQRAALNASAKQNKSSSD